MGKQPKQERRAAKAKKAQEAYQERVRLEQERLRAAATQDDLDRLLRMYQPDPPAVPRRRIG